MSFAVKKDGTGWRAVDGPEPNPEVMTWEFPDYEHETFSLDDPPAAIPLPEEVLERARVERDRLLSIAAMRIAPLQDAVDLDKATDAEVGLLKKWKQYRVALNQVQDQQGFPENISWPVEPS
jgi:hypothetical protein